MPCDMQESLVSLASLTGTMVWSFGWFERLYCL